MEGDLAKTVGRKGPNRRMPSRLEVLTLIDDLINDELSLAVVASRSYRHQLGFDKYVLQAGSTGACLRLHYWGKPAVEEEDIHSHCAGFESTVLLGKLTQEAFSIVPGDTHALFRYRFDVSRGESEADAVGFCSVHPTSRKIFQTGDGYSLDAAVLHRITAVSPGTMTMSHWEPRQHDALVLKPARMTAGPSCARSGTAVSVVRQQLKDIWTRLSVT